jgi:hypothetical protein
MLDNLLAFFGRVGLKSVQDEKGQDFYNLTTALKQITEDPGLKVTIRLLKQKHVLLWQSQEERSQVVLKLRDHQRVYNRYDPVRINNQSKSLQRKHQKSIDSRASQIERARRCSYPGCFETAPRGVTTTNFKSTGNICKKHAKCKASMLSNELVNVIDAQGGLDAIMDWKERVGSASLQLPDGSNVYTCQTQLETITKSLLESNMHVSLYNRRQILMLNFTSAETMAEVQNLLHVCSKTYARVSCSSTKPTGNTPQTFRCTRCNMNKTGNEFYKGSFKCCKHCKCNNQQTKRSIEPSR